MPPLFLTEAEIAEICFPLVQAKAQTRYLRDVLQLNVRPSPSGKPRVLRADVQAMAANSASVSITQAEAPDVSALLKKIARETA